MKNTLKIKMLVVLAIIAVILGLSNISNAYSVGATLSSSDKLVAGGTVKVTLSLSNIDAEEGITVITIDKVSYDTNVFEAITASSFAGSNGWTASYSTNSQALNLINNSHIKENGTAVTLTLKVKEGVTATSASVTFEKIVASPGLTTGDISVGTKSVTINADKDAVSEEKPTPGNTTPGNTTTGNKTPANTSAPKTNTTTVKDNSTSSKSTLPKTGVEQNALIAIVVVAVIAIFSYALYKRIARDVK